MAQTICCNIKSLFYVNILLACPLVLVINILAGILSKYTYLEIYIYVPVTINFFQGDTCQDCQGLPYLAEVGSCSENLVDTFNCVFSSSRLVTFFCHRILKSCMGV